MHKTVFILSRGCAFHPEGRAWLRMFRKTVTRVAFGCACERDRRHDKKTEKRPQCGTS